VSLARRYPAEERMEPSNVSQQMPLSTGLEIPGMVVREGLGDVFGLVVRSLGCRGR
jgi:hypothetical protein